MKILVGSEIGGYTFNKTAKTVTLTGLATITIDKVLLITNVVSNTIIYSFDSSALGGTISGNVITLTYDTAAMNDADFLMIFIDYPNNLVPVSVVGDPSIVPITPTISTGIYAANDIIGGKQTITNAMRKSGGGGYLMSVAIEDKDNEKAAMEGFVFDSDPTAGTYTDNATMVMGTDLAKSLVTITVAASDYKNVGAVARAEVDVKKLVVASGSANLFAVWRVVGTPTFTSTSDLTFKYKFDRY